MLFIETNWLISGCFKCLDIFDKIFPCLIANKLKKEIENEIEYKCASYMSLV